MMPKTAPAVGLPSAIAVAAIACSAVGTTPTAPRPDPPDASVALEGVGELRMDLTLPDGALAGAIAYVLSDAGGTPLRQGTVATGSGPAVEFQLGGVPAGGGYTVTLTATFDGGARCIGSVGPFAIAAHSTVAERVTLQCTNPTPDAGNVFVETAIGYCAGWTSLSSVAAT